MESLIRDIKTITETFEYGNESGALDIIESLNSDPILLNVVLDDPGKNKEFVDALDGLSEFKKKFEDKFPYFVTLIYNLGESAKKP